MMYQVAGRHSEPYKTEPPAKPVLEAVTVYDRTRLSTRDVLRARATVKYAGRGPTYLVSVGLWRSPSAPTPPPAAHR